MRWKFYKKFYIVGYPSSKRYPLYCFDIFSAVGCKFPLKQNTSQLFADDTFIQLWSGLFRSHIYVWYFYQITVELGSKQKCTGATQDLKTLSCALERSMDSTKKMLSVTKFSPYQKNFGTKSIIWHSYFLSPQQNKKKEEKNSGHEIKIDFKINRYITIGN